MDLARRCRSSDPAQRPGDFSQVRAELDRIARGDGWPVPDSAKVGAAMLGFFPLFAAITRSMKVMALLRIGDYQAAVDLVDRMPPDTRDWKLWLYWGTALSLLERDEEALDSYQQAGFAIGIPRSKEDEDAWWEVDRERATSLKRLCRFEEAIVVLEHLIATGDEDRRLHAMHNLAALFITTGRYAEAQSLLAHVITHGHETEKPFLNLAALYQAVGDYPAVAEALSRAVARRPGSLLARQRLGETLLVELGQVAEAADALEGALGVGGIDPRLLVARLACAVLMADVPVTERILDLAERHHGREEMVYIFHSARMWAAIVARRFFQPIEEIEATLTEEMREVVKEEAESLAKGTPPRAPLPPANPSQHGAAPEKVGLTATGDPSHDDSSEADSLSADQPEDDGFFPYRTAAGTLGYDLYVPFSSPNFAQNVATRHHSIASFLAFQVGLSIAGTPLLLVRCGSCGAELVTNRPQGETFTCQVCQQESAVTPAEDADLAGIRAELDRLLYSEGVSSMDGSAVDRRHSAADSAAARGRGIVRADRPAPRDGAASRRPFRAGLRPRGCGQGRFVHAWPPLHGGAVALPARASGPIVHQPA
jgi:tetratricopeptide (TPR) repeat protein